MTSRVDRIREVLGELFAPTQLEIVDDSAKHAGHAARNQLAAGETHYSIVMVSSAFFGQSRLARSRKVHDALAAEFESGLHALSLKLSAPEEALFQKNAVN